MKMTVPMAKTVPAMTSPLLLVVWWPTSKQKKSRQQQFGNSVHLVTLISKSLIHSDKRLTLEISASETITVYFYGFDRNEKWYDHIRESALEMTSLVLQYADGSRSSQVTGFGVIDRREKRCQLPRIVGWERLKKYKDLASAGEVSDLSRTNRQTHWRAKEESQSIHQLISKMVF